MRCWCSMTASRGRVPATVRCPPSRERSPGTPRSGPLFFGLKPNRSSALGSSEGPRSAREDSDAGNRRSALKPARAPNREKMLFPGPWPAGRRTTPSKVSPVVTRQPARLAQLHDGNDRAISVHGDEGPAQVVQLGHQGTPSVICQRRWRHSSPPAPYHLSVPSPWEPGSEFRGWRR